MIQNMKHIFLILLVLMGLISCKSSKNSQVKKNNFNELLINTWNREGEKDVPPNEQYRPKSYVLPPSRGRESISFSKDGKIELKEIAPACGFETFQGNWKVLENGQIEIIIPLMPEKNFKIEIISLDKSSLILKRIF